MSEEQLANAAEAIQRLSKVRSKDARTVSETIYILIEHLEQAKEHLKQGVTREQEDIDSPPYTWKSQRCVRREYKEVLADLESLDLDKNKFRDPDDYEWSSDSE